MELQNAMAAAVAWLLRRALAEGLLTRRQAYVFVSVAVGVAAWVAVRRASAVLLSAVTATHTVLLPRAAGARGRRAGALVAQPRSPHLTALQMTSDEGSGGVGIAGVAGLIGLVAAVAASAAIWLVLSQPVTVATAVDTREVLPLMRALAEVIYRAMAGLIDYL